MINLNANAGTGEQGMRDAMQTCQDLANMTGGNMAQVLPFSTGVIGQALILNLTAEIIVIIQS